MVVLTPRFTLLAALSTIAAVSALPTPGDTAAVQVHYRDVDSSSSASAHHSTHAHDFTHTASADASRSTSPADSSDGKSQRHSNPVIPLPSSKSDATINKVAKSPTAKDETKEHGKGVKYDKGKRFIWDPLNPLLGLGPDIWIGDSSRENDRLGKRHSHDHDRDHDHEKVIVKGDHDHVNAQRSLPVSRIMGRAPDNILHVSGDILPRAPDNILHVSGDVLPHAPRSPQPHHHHDHDHEEVIVKGDHDHVNVHRRGSPGSTYVADEGGNSYTVAHARRDDLQMPGVPGSIDIVTGMLNSITPQQKIASLVLSSSDNSTMNSDNSTMSSGNDTIPSFILNASGTDQTQIYLVAAPSDPSNSTMPSNSMVPSNSTMPSNSTTSSNSTASNSTVADPSFIKVALQIPMFDEDAAMLKAYCATFDPNPPAPSPLTVEMCMNGPSTDAHKSQVFAYEPDTGVIRPMWSNSEDDGMSGSDDGSATAVSSPSSSANSTVSATSTSTANATSVASQDPAAPTSDKVASMSSLDEQFGDATRPPLRASFAKTFDAPSILAQARNVTLVFTPAAPELIPQKSVDDLDPGMSASSSANATVSATSSSSAASSSATSSSSTTDSSAIESTSTTASLITSSSTASSTSAAATTVTFTASSASNTTVSVSSVAAVPSGAKFVSLSQTTSATTGTVTSSSVASSATAPASLAVEIYDPTVSASATPSDSAVSSSDAASTVTATATTTIGAEDLAATTTAVVTSTATESNVTSTMAPMSTAAPYEWMFQEGVVEPELV